MEIAKSSVMNALTSSATNHVVAVANDIYDEAANEYQSNINENVGALIASMAEKIAILERRVTVLEGGEVTPEIGSISLNPTEITMTVEGEQATIAATIAPEGADLSALAWSIGDAGVINFIGEPTTEAATIAAVANGTTYVQLTAGELVAECAVTVAIPEPEPDEPEEPEEPDEPIVPTGEWDMGGATTEGAAIDLGNATTEGEALDFGNANVE
jgi:hypothetical protein